MDQGHVPYIYLFGVLCSTAYTKQGFMTLMTCVEMLDANLLQLEQDVIDPTIDQCMRSFVRAWWRTL